MTTYPDHVTVVGLGADGWDGLGPVGRDAIAQAEVIIGSNRQTDLVAGHHGAAVTPLPRPLRAGLPTVLAQHAGRRVVVLATGDPFHHGIGRTLVELIGPENVEVVPAVSAMSLACARMRWPVEETHVVSLVGRPASLLGAALDPGAKVLVLVSDGNGPDIVARTLRDAGYGASTMTILTDLGTLDEAQQATTAARWTGPVPSSLVIVAVQCTATPTVVGRPGGRSRAPGLPDDAYENDGQLTKRHIRAATLAMLAPAPGELLWDIGGGAGSIAIEWLRAAPTGAAYSIERSHERAARIRRNAEALAAPGLVVVEGAAPAALGALPTPHAVFIGGGLTSGALDVALARVRPGGRVVANAVTLDSESVLMTAFRERGGTLTRLEVSHTDTVGSFTSWKPARPVTQWAWTKPLAGGTA